jgi:hypothetical protein
MKTRCSPSLIAALLLISLAGGARGAEPGHDLHLADAASEYAVAAHSSGDFLVAWTDTGDGGGFGRRVHARRFGPDGRPRGEALVLGSAPPAGEPAFPSVAAVGNGRYWVAWTRVEQGIRRAVARRVGTVGVRELVRLGDGVEQAAVAGLRDGTWASVTLAADGQLVATVRSGSSGLPFRRVVVARRASHFALDSYFTGSFLVLHGAVARGVPQGLRLARFGPGAEFLGDTLVTAAADAGLPSLSVNFGEGRALAAWVSGGQVFYRLYRPSGAAVGPGRRLGAAATTVDAALLPGGEGLLVWYRFASGGSPILARRLDRQGNPVGPVFVVDAQGRAPLADGRGRAGYVAVWSNQPADDSLRGLLLPP